MGRALSTLVLVVILVVRVVAIITLGLYATGHYTAPTQQPAGASNILECTMIGVTHYEGTNSSSTFTSESAYTGSINVSKPKGYVTTLAVSSGITGEAPIPPNWYYAFGGYAYTVCTYTK